MVRTRLQECCRQIEGEVVSNSRDKIHQITCETKCDNVTTCDNRDHILLLWPLVMIVIVYLMTTFDSSDHIWHLLPYPCLNMIQTYIYQCNAKAWYYTKSEYETYLITVNHTYVESGKVTFDRCLDSALVISEAFCLPSDYRKDVPPSLSKLWCSNYQEIMRLLMKYFSGLVGYIEIQ